MGNYNCCKNRFDNQSSTNAAHRQSELTVSIDARGFQILEYSLVLSMFMEWKTAPNQKFKVFCTKHTNPHSYTKKGEGKQA